MRGVLAVTDRRSDISDRGVVDVYIQRMFINAGNREVLPPWAKFLRGVLECNELTPNAARDNVVRNAALAAVQQTLGRLVVRELTDLSKRNHQRFVEMMRWHSYDILAMSVQDERGLLPRGCGPDAAGERPGADHDRGPNAVHRRLALWPSRIAACLRDSNASIAAGGARMATLTIRLAAALVDCPLQFIWQLHNNS